MKKRSQIQRAIDALEEKKDAIRGQAAQQIAAIDQAIGELIMQRDRMPRRPRAKAAAAPPMEHRKVPA